MKIISNTNRNNLLILALFVVFPLFLVETARSISAENIQVVFPISLKILKVLKFSFVVLSCIALATPWFLYKRMNNHYRPNLNLFFIKFKVENSSLFLGCLFLFCPVIYGLLLFFVGMSIDELYYYVGASIIVTITWGIFNLIRNTANQEIQ